MVNAGVANDVGIVLVLLSPELFGKHVLHFDGGGAVRLSGAVRLVLGGAVVPVAGHHLTSPHLEVPRPHWHVLAPNRFDPFREEPLQVRGRQMLYFTLKRSRLSEARKATVVSSLFLRRRLQPTARVKPTLLTKTKIK